MHMEVITCMISNSSKFYTAKNLHYKLCYACFIDLCGLLLPQVLDCDLYDGLITALPHSSFPRYLCVTQLQTQVTFNKHFSENVQQITQ